MPEILATTPATPVAGPDRDRLRATLHARVTRECRACYGAVADAWIDHAVDDWLDYQRNDNGRWAVILHRRPAPGRILDMAAGIGTFMLHGLVRDHDVHGVEPEAWKRSFYEEQIALAGLPGSFRGRMHDAVGEALPFDDASFDLVTTYQTLEHVGDPDACLREMLRVVRPGGVLYVKAPDYRSLFEPHYRLPFLPCMNRTLAAAYLRRLGRPTLGLDELNWTTTPQVLRSVRAIEPNALIERIQRLSFVRRHEKIRHRLPPALRIDPLIRWMNHGYEMRFAIPRVLRVALAKQERNIDLWITKEAARP